MNPKCTYFNMLIGVCLFSCHLASTAETGREAALDALSQFEGEIKGDDLQKEKKVLKKLNEIKEILLEEPVEKGDSDKPSPEAESEYIGPKTGTFGTRGRSSEEKSEVSRGESVFKEFKLEPGDEKLFEEQYEGVTDESSEASSTFSSDFESSEQEPEAKKKVASTFKSDVKEVESSEQEPEERKTASTPRSDVKEVESSEGESGERKTASTSRSDAGKVGSSKQEPGKIGNESSDRDSSEESDLSTSLESESVEEEPSAESTPKKERRDEPSEVSSISHPESEGPSEHSRERKNETPSSSNEESAAASSEKQEAGRGASAESEQGLTAEQQKDIMTDLIEQARLFDSTKRKINSTVRTIESKCPRNRELRTLLDKFKDSLNSGTTEDLEPNAREINNSMGAVAAAG